MKKAIQSLLFIFTLLFLFNPTLIKAQMFWNQAASFTGSPTSYVKVLSSSSLELAGNLSLEAWVNPSVTTLSRGIISKGGTLGTNLIYGLRLSSGRVLFATNGAPRLFSKTSSLVSANRWTHLSATYNSSSGSFKIYINGILDTSSVVAGAAPTSNTDSLFIGISGTSTPFNGKLDEVRVWNRELSASEVKNYMRTSLGTSSGIYSGLVMSMTFQKESSSGTKFTTRDFSGNENNGIERNVTAFDQSFRPLQTISQNDNIEFDGNEDYLAAKDTSTLNSINVITLECWVYPRTANQTCNLISKGNQYALILENGILKFKANGSTASSNRNVPADEWTKVTVQSDGLPQFHINGLRVSGSQPFLGALVSGTDSLYVGGVPGATGDFNGFMDEVRIFNHFFSDDEIYHMSFSSIDKSNAPVAGEIRISYNLDGTLYDNSESGGPKLIFRNNAQFSHPGSDVYKPVSPLIRDLANAFPKGFYQGEENNRIPLTGGSSLGASNYLKRINMDVIINDIDIMIALNHTNLSSLNITVIAPNNDSVRIAANLSTTTSDNSLVTIFDDQADSSFAAGRYVSFHTTMKPLNNMNSVFAGDNSLGTWRIRINDLAAGDTGVLNMFGIQINNMPVIENNMFLTSLIQGFYNPATDFTIRDTVTLYLRKKFSPYEIVDSCSREMNQFGESAMSFKNVIRDTLYTLSLEHRNSIEIWSSITRVFKYSTSTMSFYLSAIASVYGGNEIQVDTSPVRFAMYGGDVNQDGVVDATDAGAIDNDAFNFATGYINTDLTGDDVVDASDGAIADNNAFNFVARITPLD